MMVVGSISHAIKTVVNAIPPRAAPRWLIVALACTPIAWYALKYLVRNSDFKPRPIERVTPPGAVSLLDTISVTPDVTRDTLRLDWLRRSFIELAKKMPDRANGKSFILYRVLEVNKEPSSFSLSSLQPTERLGFLRAFAVEKIAIKPELQIEMRRGYYGYDVPNAIWVDFAAAHLGGGAIDTGWVQEERMFAAIPSLIRFLIDVKMQRQSVIVSDRSGPNPLLIQNASLVYAIDEAQAYYGKALETHNSYLSPPQKAEAIVQATPPRKIDILAIAAPNLAKRGKAPSLEEQLDLDTLRQIYLAVRAGFGLVCEVKRGGDFTICSGKFGCGVFGNNLGAVYIIQRIVANLLNVKLVLYAFDPEEKVECEQKWTEFCTRLAAIESPQTPDQLLRVIVQVVRAAASPA